MIEALKNKLTQENVVIFLFSMIFWFYSAPMGVYNGTVILTTLWGIYYFIRHRQQVFAYFKDSRFIWLFGLVVIPMVVSALFSGYPGESWKTVVNFLRFFFIGSLVLLLTLPALEKIRYAILAYIVLISLDAIIEWLTGYHLMGESRDRVRIMGLFQYYHLGYVLATLTPFIFYQTIASFAEKTGQQYYWLLGSVLAVIAIFIAGSRAGVVTLLVSLGLIMLHMIIQKKISLKWISGGILAIVIAGVAISQLPIVKNRYINTLESTEQAKIGSYEWIDRVSSDRLVLWQFAWREYQNNPVIGSGSGTFEKAFKTLPVEERGVHIGGAGFPHFYGLEILSQTGTLGFISYLLAACSVFVMLLRSKKFSVWLAVAFLAMMPINLHVSFYGSFWAALIWMPLILGLRERYLIAQKYPANT